MVSGLTVVEDPCVIVGVILKSIFLLGDGGNSDPGVGGIRSGRGGVLGFHFATGDPSFGEVWRYASLSVSAIMLFISCLQKSQPIPATRQ